ncbi:NAD(P)H-quinone oxidoreductase subunit I, chloroplastic [subsurface metagenome]
MKFERYGIGIAKSMAVTLKNLFRKPITVQYPEEKLTVSRRIRGTTLVWDKDACTACKLCATACPQSCITIVTFRDESHKLRVDKLDFDGGLCSFCGLCVEACPCEALFMGYSYEWATYRQQDLMLSKEELMLSERRRPSGYARPEVEATLPQQTLLLDRDKAKK